MERGVLINRCGGLQLVVIGEFHEFFPCESLQNDVHTWESRTPMPMNHLAEVVRSKPDRPVDMGKRHIPPHFGPFWAYSRALPQGVELLV